eukprot:TRINITY_DN510381_c0_g1_i3.p1 TRINITY_DN510381_c0_g1~~TRINITY_DN510381_c0_g1_i3.p1  ORF type:complete len:384 (+),score=84.89 TRINITY_DN510381_c0_g1_i3:280-1431(+)
MVSVKLVFFSFFFFRVIREVFGDFGNGIRANRTLTSNENGSDAGKLLERRRLAPTPPSDLVIGIVEENMTIGSFLAPGGIFSTDSDGDGDVTFNILSANAKSALTIGTTETFTAQQLTNNSQFRRLSMWIGLSGKVLRFDAKDDTLVGSYKMPNTVYDVKVDLIGNAWVLMYESLNNFIKLLKIGDVKQGQCVDVDGDDIIETGDADTYNYTNDECVLKYISFGDFVISADPKSLTLLDNGIQAIVGLDSGTHYLIHLEVETIEEIFTNVSCGGIDALIYDNTYWSVGAMGLLGYDLNSDAWNSAAACVLTTPGDSIAVSPKNKFLFFGSSNVLYRYKLDDGTVFEKTYDAGLSITSVIIKDISNYFIAVFLGKFFFMFFKDI